MHLDSDAGRDWGQEEKGMTADEMAGCHHRQMVNGIRFLVIQSRSTLEFYLILLLGFLNHLIVYG